MIRIETKICLGVAGIHFILFFITAIYIASIADGQAPMLWALFYFIDYPVSLLLMILGEPYKQWFDTLSYPIPAIFFYPPHVIFGVMGTCWWYLIASFFVRLSIWVNKVIDRKE